jgi:hypothetical protein
MLSPACLACSEKLWHDWRPLTVRCHVFVARLALMRLAPLLPQMSSGDVVVARLTSLCSLLVAHVQRADPAGEALGPHGGGSFRNGLFAFVARFGPSHPHVSSALAFPPPQLWMPTLKTLMVFYTGQFDQLIYTEPHSGMT